MAKVRLLSGAYGVVVAWVIEALLFAVYLRHVANYKTAAGSLLGVYVLTTSSCGRTCRARRSEASSRSSETCSSLGRMPAIPHRATPHGAFGDDTFGRFAEKTARFFGTPQYIIGQTIIVALWIAFNSIALFHPFDRRPYIMLNLIFSTQAAYAAPLILLAQTRQADRDKMHGDIVEKRHTRLEEATDKAAQEIVQLLNSNTTLTQQDKDLTEEVAKLTKEIHTLLTQQRAAQ